MGVLSRAVILVIAVLAGVVGSSFVPACRDVLPDLGIIHQATLDSWSLVRPGGKWHPAGFIEHHGHLVLEGFLVAVISYLLFQRSSKPSKKALRPLTEKEIQELCDEWQPEPLYGQPNDFQRMWLAAEPVLTSEPGRLVSINGHQALDMVSLNFLGLATEASVREAAHATIRKYGVGSCGPRGFYGTLDVHLELEERLARFMGSQEAILYSYDLATLSSIIPAFANRKDIIVMDAGCSYGVRNGCHLSRARVLTFRHNDVADLERVLQSVAQEDRRNRRPLNRRFVVVEGVYANTGDVAPLKAIAELKERYKYRLIVDESVALGVLGESGRGAAQAAGLGPQDVEIVGASLGNAVASIGGFCAGDREIVDHQRLSGLGYCFSASLPPYLASAATAALDIMERDGPERMEKVRVLAARFRRSAAAKVPGLHVVGGAESAASPLVHLQLEHELPRELWHRGDFALQKVVEECLARDKVMFTVAKYSQLEDQTRPPPSIRVVISAAHADSDIDKAVSALASSCKRTLPTALAQFL